MHPHFKRQSLSLLAAALFTATSTQLFAQSLPAGALPTGWSVASGNVSIAQNGTTLNINQATPQALVNFSTFNVGSGALVNIRQLNSSSALLARTTGGDPSQIYGQIKANGALWLINPAGIMVGAGARIDVGSFIVSTLNVSDSDFLAGRLTFKAGGTPGELRNAGTINAASGGSIYLVGPKVSNTGTLNAPNGEVLLAAGQTVQLVDTGTPGVSVAITGVPGEVRNLGRITAEAGRIGLAAGLIANSGSINASSVVREGGRIFLRASGDLATSATSDISANGRSGGQVVLYADGAAHIDGNVSATGSTGPGGYVDTSGRRMLDVVNAPVVGRGGEWHIDPLDIEIVAAGPDRAVTSGNAIVSTETGAQISAGTIVTQLDLGTNVSITTGSPTTALGDITVSAGINKTGNVDSALTLNASNNIIINAPITSSNSKLALNLKSNYQGNSPVMTGHAVQLNANIDLNGGALNVSEGTMGAPNGTLNVAAGGSVYLNQATSTLNAATVNVLTGGSLYLAGAGASVSGILNNSGTIVKNGAGSTSLSLANLAGGTVQVNQGELDAGLSASNPNNGAIVLQAGATLGSGQADLYNNGSISGSGVIALGGSATLFNNGTVSPGTSAALGRLTVQGNYKQGSTGVLNIKLSGTGSSQFDLLDIDGSAGLGGTLNLSTLGTFASASGAFADIVFARSPSNSGAFSQVNLPPASSSNGGPIFSVSYPGSGNSAARVTAAFAPALGTASGPIASALNSTVNIINSILSSPIGPSPLTSSGPQIGTAGGSATDNQKSAKDDGKPSSKAQDEKLIAKTDPVKKMYCN
ncbi:filamentous hemagglutinin N-terminal domain-containing protein [Polaromonas jejuensis]|uniref:Filamentous hemagglutinin N-terminal domain-containing protein n=1 Tax=Polaromonas jejuensis TaxID=457502 RepID=A0ABW0Q957_9BURK|nr:filamentous hemagglutinin N-terminal domain-containing protein [Polaromonas jejuensis]